LQSKNIDFDQQKIVPFAVGVPSFFFVYAEGLRESSCRGRAAKNIQMPNYAAEFFTITGCV